MKRIFSIIMEWGLGLPMGTIAFWGTLVPQILTDDHTFKGLLHFRSSSLSLEKMLYGLFDCILSSLLLYIEIPIAQLSVCSLFLHTFRYLRYFS